MALRTMAYRMRDHDWTGVVVEIAIVVIGVFLGIQASNWNQDRQDAARGRDYLQRIEGDLTAEIAVLRNMQKFTQSVGAYGDAAIAYAENGTLYKGSAWETLLAYYQASQVWPFRQPSTTFQEIRSGGELQLIRNPTLRAHIAAHYDERAASHTQEVLDLLPRYREDVRGMTPWPVQRYIWTHCYRMTRTLGQELIDCAAPISDPDATALVESFRQDRSLTAGLRFWQVNVNNIEAILGDIRDQAEQLSHDVRAELDRH